MKGPENLYDITGVDTMETLYIIAGAVALLVILVVFWMIKKAIKMMLLVLFLIVVVVVGAGCYFYFGYYKDDGDDNETVDTTAPGLITSSVVDLNVSANITIDFTEAMAKDTIKVNATCQDTAMILNGTWTYDAVAFAISFNPTDDLAAGKTYVFTLLGKDLAGNDLAVGTKFTATT